MKILNGPIGTELIKRLGNREILDEYNLINSEGVAKIYRDYIDRGASLLVTNTFNAHKASLEKSKYSVKEINQAALAICQRFNLEIAGSVGASRLSVTKNPERKRELVDSYKEQLEYLSECEYILHETIYDFENAKCFKDAFKEIGSKQKLLLSTCITDMTKLEKLFTVFESLSPEAIGLNCVSHDEQSIKALNFLEQKFKRQLIYYPNNLSCRVQTKDLNLSYIGACCGSDIESYSQFSEIS